MPATEKLYQTGHSQQRPGNNTSKSHLASKNGPRGFPNPQPCQNRGKNHPGDDSWYRRQCLRPIPKYIQPLPIHNQCDDEPTPQYHEDRVGVDAHDSWNGDIPEYWVSHSCSLSKINLNFDLRNIFAHEIRRAFSLRYLHWEEFGEKSHRVHSLIKVQDCTNTIHYIGLGFNHNYCK